jgi:long-chain fatty acid transport protein
MRSDRLRPRGLTGHATLIATAVLAVLSRPAAAQGFGLNDIGSCAIARAYAATGAPCQDASVIYWNPGAASMLHGLSVDLGVTPISVNGTFQSDTTLTKYHGDVPVTVIPDLFINYGWQLSGHDASVGVGVYVPYGLTSQWSPDFPGRFEAQKATLQSIYVQPNFAFDIIPHVLTVGAGPVIGFSSIELVQALDLSGANAEPGVTFGQLGFPEGTEFGQATLKGSSTAYGYAVGAQYHPAPTIAIGVRYLSALTFSFNNAKATFTQVPTGLVLAAGNPFGLPGGTPLDALLAGQFLPDSALSSQGVTTRVTDPYQIQVGVGFTGLSHTVIDLDYAYFGYESFQTLPITFTGPAAAAGLNRTLIEDYGSSWSIRLGAEHMFESLGITGRAGFSYAVTPAPPVTVTPLLPDMNRYNGSVGIGVPITPGFELDGSYLHVFTDGRRGRIVERTDASQTAAELNSGFYTLDADVLSLSLRIQP